MCLLVFLGSSTDFQISLFLLKPSRADTIQISNVSNRDFTTLYNKTIMSFQPKRLDVLCLAKVIKQKLQEQEPNMEYLEDFLSRLPPDINHLALECLLNDSSLNDNQFVNYLSLYLDKRTKHFSMRATKCHETIKAVLQLITKLSPNIETIDFTEISLESPIEDEFIYFLKNCKNLKALRVYYSIDLNPDDTINVFYSCLINDEHFAKLDEDVRSRLETIDFIKFGRILDLSSFNKIIERLPNLKNFTYPLDRVFGLWEYLDLCLALNRTFELDEIRDELTYIERLVKFAKVFPKVTKVTLNAPDTNVVANLCKFPLLSELTLYYYDPKELIEYLKKYGKSITTLELYNPTPIKRCIVDKALYLLCPNLVNLTNQNWKTYKKGLNK